MQADNLNRSGIGAAATADVMMMMTIGYLIDWLID
jgi:hypothetical protein